MRKDLHRAVREVALQIAIDGPAGAGKSTVGRNLARALGCPYLDTGLMYRAAALRALEQGVPPSDGEALAALARVKPLRLVSNEAAAPTEGVATSVLNDAQVLLPLAGLLDINAERTRLDKQRNEAEAEIARLSGLPGEELFTAAKELGAPYELVAEVARAGRLPVVLFTAGGIATLAASIRSSTAMINPANPAVTQ